MARASGVLRGAGEDTTAPCCRAGCLPPAPVARSVLPARLAMRSACWAAKRRPLLRSPEAGSLRASRCARLAGRRSAALYSGRPKRAPCAPSDALGLLGVEAPPSTPVARSGLPARLAMRSACWASKRRPLLRSPEAGSLRGSRGARLAGRRSAALYFGRPKRAPCAAREALALLGGEAPPFTSLARYRSLIRGLPPTPAEKPTKNKWKSNPSVRSVAAVAAPSVAAG